MLCNWYTIDACFIFKPWRMRSNAVLAGSCIGDRPAHSIRGVLQTDSPGNDRYILRQYIQAHTASAYQNNSGSEECIVLDNLGSEVAQCVCHPRSNLQFSSRLREQLSTWHGLLLHTLLCSWPCITTDIL